mmetsp:Transcript_4919/g.5759  ORF Transcript_4919/g.5759 Transcript_4919/m.5759 type:complete len:762 (-) Transcript_4919:66-2351(-)
MERVEAASAGVPPQGALLPQGAVFSIEASQVNMDQVFREERSGVEITAPLCVPEEGLQAWELLGSDTGLLHFKQPLAPLGLHHTIALWVKFVPRREATPFSAVLHTSTNDSLLTIDPKSGRIGIHTSNSSAPHWFRAEVAPGWQLLVLTGQCSSRSSSTVGTSILYTSSAPHKGLDLDAADTISAVCSGRQLTSIGRSGSALGWVSSLHIWDRVLSADELRMLWEKTSQTHGIILLTSPSPASSIHGRVTTSQSDASGAPGVAAEPPGVAAGVLGVAAGAPGVAVGVPGVAVTARITSTSSSLAQEVVVLTAFTTSDGHFQIDLTDETLPPDILQSGGICRLSFTHEGFAPTIHRLDIQPVNTLPLHDSLSEFIDVTLGVISASREISIETGGIIDDVASGMQLTVPPGLKFIREDGTLYSEGMVRIAIKGLNMEDPTAVDEMPGGFGGLSLDEEPVSIESYGAMWIGISESGSRGGPLEVSSDTEGLSTSWASTAPVASALRSGHLPTTWHLDDLQGLWVQQPMPIQVNNIALPLVAPPTARNIASCGPNNTIIDIDPSRQRVAKKGKGKKNAALSKPMRKENTNDNMIAHLLRQFEKGGKNNFKMSGIRKQGWWNCDALFAHSIIKGRVVFKGEVIRDTVTYTYDRDPQQQHATAGIIQLVARGRDYRGKSYTRASIADGGFNLVVQHSSKVSIEVRIESQLVVDELARVGQETVLKSKAVNSGARTRTLRIVNIGEHASRNEGDVLDIGTIDLVDFSS